MSTSTDSTPEVQSPRLKLRYREEIVPALREQFEYANVMQVPGLTKIVVNMGVGEAARDSKLIEGAVRDLTAITGQKPQVTKARKSIAQFKLREGMPIGAHVTLRGDRRWEFLDRLLSLALPRIRDFRGLSPRSFDGRGNYSIGIKEQIIFPEINYDDIQEVRGLVRAPSRHVRTHRTPVHVQHRLDRHRTGVGGIEVVDDAHGRVENATSGVADARMFHTPRLMRIRSWPVTGRPSLDAYVRTNLHRAIA